MLLLFNESNEKQTTYLLYWEQNGYTSKTSMCFRWTRQFSKVKDWYTVPVSSFFNCRGTSKEINHTLKANTFKSIKQQEKNQTRTNKLIFENYKLIK